MVQWKKKKRKELVCPWQEAISIYFWVIGMSYYLEGHNRTVENYRSAQTSFKSLDSLLCLLGQIYLTKLDISIGFQRCGSSATLDISDLWPQVKYIRPAGFIWPPLGSRTVATAPVRHIRPAEYIWSSLGSRPLAAWTDQTYPTHRIYPVFIGFQNRVTSHWSDISEPHQIYPTQPNTSQFESPIGHIELGRIYPIFWHIQWS
jgi:hypothetical protein